MDIFPDSRLIFKKHVNSCLGSVRDELDTCHTNLPYILFEVCSDLRGDLEFLFKYLRIHEA